MRNLVFCLSFLLIHNSTAYGSITKRVGPISFQDVKDSYKSSDVMMVDANNENLEKIRLDKSERSLQWIDLNEVSHAFKTLLLKSEDRKFYEHSGVDWTALVTAGVQHILHSGNRGASTLSMQLVGLLDKDVKRHRVTWGDKWDQIQKALFLEKTWKKEEIFEAYINLVAFRGELVGISSASFGYFNKSPGSLNNEESALLVSLLRSPNAGADLVASRACQLLEYTNCTLVKKFSKITFSEQYEIKRPRQWVAVVDPSFIKKDNHNTNLLKTTLDKNIQEKAVLTLQEQVRFYKSQNLSDGAILVLNNKTGEVVAYVANSGENYSPTPHVDGIRAQRQAGSTLKPIVYATAIEMNLIHQDTLIDDSAVDIVIGNHSIYYPRNYDNTFKGLVTAGEALGSSLNVPAVKVLQLASGERVVKKLKKLGIKNVREASYYGPSLALGSLDVSLWDLTHAYQKLLTSKVFSKNTKEEIFQMMSSDENRRFTFGAGSILKLPFPAAVKTGTSKDMRDNWCVGFSELYTVGVWVGNFNGKAMWNVSGVTGAAPLWQAVMMELHKNSKNKIQTILTSAPMPFESKIEKTISSIRYPINSEIVGLDPEIPPHLQKMMFEIVSPDKNLKLFLDDKYFANAGEQDFWSISRGQHKLVLVNSDEKIIDQVNFEVR